MRNHSKKYNAGACREEIIKLGHTEKKMQMNSHVREMELGAIVRIKLRVGYHAGRMKLGL